MASDCDDPTHGPEIEALVAKATALTNARDFAAAQTVIEHIETADPDNPFGAHVRIHLHIDEGTLAEGAKRGLEFLQTHDPFEGINVHNAMHLAAILLDLARAGESIEWQTRVVVPVAESMPMQYPSAAQLLWRTEVAGYGRQAATPLPWPILVRLGASALAGPDDRPHPLDAIAHGMAWIANGDGARRGPLLDALLANGLADSHRVGAEANAATVATVIDGLAHWWDADYVSSARLLGSARSGFGALTEYAGQLGAIEDTLIDAEWRSGVHFHSREILEARIANAANAYPRDLAWLARIEAASGHAAHARALAHRAAALWVNGDLASVERAAAFALA